MEEGAWLIDIRRRIEPDRQSGVVVDGVASRRVFDEQAQIVDRRVIQVVQGMLRNIPKGMQRSNVQCGRIEKDSQGKGWSASLDGHRQYRPFSTGEQTYFAIGPRIHRV